MKKILYIILTASMGMLSLNAHAASCVSVKQTGTNYAAKTVTFVLSWSGCNGTNHLNTVWCFIDWRTVNAAGNKGNWTHATISGKPTVTGASLGTVQTDGFWVTGTSSATVTVALGNAPAMFDWCAFASDCKSTGQAISIAGCANTSICLGETGFVSTQTWVVGAQTWSAPVTATYCNKTGFNGGNTGAFNSDCRTNSTAGYGHLFSWCMVARFASSICPGGWRVPTSADFCTLDKALNGRSNCSYRTDATSRNRYLNTWGGQYGGYAYSGSLYTQGSHADYWSQSEGSSTYGYSLYFTTNGYVYPQTNDDKYYGFTLRCVR